MSKDNEKKSPAETKPVEPPKEKHDPFKDPKNQPDLSGPPKHDKPVWQKDSEK